MPAADKLDLRDRDACFAALDGAAFDVAVIGGGITGAGVARDAAMRGLRVALLEAEDFASGTSSRSSKMIHGGLRYLPMGDIRLSSATSSSIRRCFRGSSTPGGRSARRRLRCSDVAWRSPPTSPTSRPR